MKVRDILNYIKDKQKYGHYMLMYFSDLDKEYGEIAAEDLRREQQGLPSISRIIKEYNIDIKGLEIEQMYEDIPKDLRGKDSRLSTLEGLMNKTSDVVDLQNSVKAFIEDQLDKITKLFDDFWEKNPNVENNPYEQLLNLFVRLYSYADDNDFEDVYSDLGKVLKKS
jgi:hypothetical protein